MGSLVQCFRIRPAGIVANTTQDMPDCEENMMRLVGLPTHPRWCSDLDNVAIKRDEKVLAARRIAQ